jgi:hypothetical protein
MSNGPTYLVLQSETCDDDGELWAATTPFPSLDKAKAYLKKVINEEWGPMKLEFPDGITMDVNLGDYPGYKYPSNGSIKHSLVFFDEDGDEAWDILGYTKKKIKIVKIGKEGERTC